MDNMNNEEIISNEFHYTGKNKSSVIKGLSIKDGILSLRSLPPADFFTSPEKYILETDPETMQPSVESLRSLNDYRRLFAEVKELHIEGHNTKRGKKLTSTESDDTAFVFTPEIAMSIRDSLGGGFTRIEINNSNVMMKGNGVEQILMADVLSEEEKEESIKRLHDIEKEIKNAQTNLDLTKASDSFENETLKDDAVEAIKLKINAMKNQAKAISRNLNLNCDAFEMIIRQDSPKALDDSGRVRFAFADIDTPMVLKVEAKDGIKEEKSQNIIRPGFMAGSRILSILAPDANMSVGPAAFSQITNTATALSRIREYESGVIELSELTQDMERFTKDFRKTFEYTKKEKEASERFVNNEMLRDYNNLEAMKNRYDLNEADKQAIKEKEEEKKGINPPDDDNKKLYGYDFLKTQVDALADWNEKCLNACEGLSAIAGPERSPGAQINSDDINRLNRILNETMMKRYEYLSSILETNYPALVGKRQGLPASLFEKDKDYFGKSEIGELLLGIKREKDETQYNKAQNLLKSLHVPEDRVVEEWLRLYHVYGNTGKTEREHVFDLDKDCITQNADLQTPTDMFRTNAMEQKLGEVKATIFKQSFRMFADEILRRPDWKEVIQNRKSISREEMENDFIRNYRLTSKDGLKGTQRTRLTYFEPNQDLYDRIVSTNMEIIKIREEKDYYYQNQPELVDKWKENIIRSQELRERIINQTNETKSGEFKPIVGITGVINRENLVMAGLESNRVGTLSFNYKQAIGELYSKRYEALRALTFTLKDFREKEEKRINEKLESFKKRIDDLTWDKLELERRKNAGESFSSKDETRLKEINAELAGMETVIKRSRQVFEGVCDIYSTALSSWEDCSHSLKIEDDSFIPTEEHFALIDNIENRITEAVRTFIETDRKRIYPNGTDVPEETKADLGEMLGGVSGFQWDWGKSNIIQFEKMRIEQSEIIENSQKQVLDERSGNFKGVAAEFNATGIDGAAYDSRQWTDEFVIETSFHSANRNKYRDFLKQVDKELPQSNKMLVRLQELNAQELRDLMGRNADYLNSELASISKEIEKYNIRSSEINTAIDQIKKKYFDDPERKSKKYPFKEIRYQEKLLESIDKERHELIKKEKQLSELVQRIEPQLVYHETEEGRFTQFELDTEAYFRADRFLHDNKTVENYIINHSARGQELKRKIKEFEKQYGTLNERTGQYELVPGVSTLFTDKNNAEALEEYQKISKELGEFMRKGMPTTLSDLADGGSKNAYHITVGENIERTVGYAMNNEKMKYEGLDVNEDGKISDVTVSDLIAERLSKANRHYIRVGKIKDGLKDVGKSLAGNVHYYSATQAVTLSILLMIACGVKAISAGGKLIAHANQEARLKKETALLWLKEEIEKNCKGGIASAFFDNSGDTIRVKIGDFTVKNSEYEKMFAQDGKVEVSRAELNKIMNDYDKFSKVFSQYAKDRKETNERENKKIQKATEDAKKYAKDFSSVLDSVKTVSRTHKPLGKKAGRT